VKRLERKVAIITGAASGQGAAESELFAAEGARVVLTDVNEQPGRDKAERIGNAAIFIHHDVTDPISWQSVVSTALDAFGGIDILINNAGVYIPRTFQATDQSLLDLHYKINVLAPFLGMRAVYPVMQKAGGGAIVNVASGAGTRGYPGMAAYAASKWMLRGLSRCAAIDLAEYKIRVNGLLPGLIDTPMLAGNSKEHMDYLASLPPTKRLGTSEEVALAALYLVSHEASYVTGTDLAVCGGLTA
jgi:3alpha(or 20beta)-hydroxysteroid dehydrogenase